MDLGKIYLVEKLVHLGKVKPGILAIFMQSGNLQKNYVLDQKNDFIPPPQLCSSNF